jgi:hypothetical protein
MGAGYHMGPSPYGCGYDDLSAIARMTPYGMACKAKNGRAKGNIHSIIQLFHKCKNMNFQCMTTFDMHHMYLANVKAHRYVDQR